MMISGYENKNCIVSGGSGFLGQVLVNRLVNLGAEVFVIDNFKFGAQKIAINPKAKIIEGDVRNPKTFQKLPNFRYAYFFHFAGPSSIILFDKDLLDSVDITINGFLNAARFCLENKIRLVYPSTGSLYSGTKTPQSEKSEINVEALNSYAKTKLTLESIQKSLKGLDCLGLRIFAGYGPQEKNKGEFASIIYLFCKNMIAGKPSLIFGNGNQKRDFIYVDDVIEATLILAKKSKDRIVNIGSGQSISFNEIVDVINQNLGKKIKPIYITKPEGYLEETLSDNNLLKKYFISKISINEGIKRTLESLKE